jgi:hypothetical protein
MTDLLHCLLLLLGLTTVVVADDRRVRQRLRQFIAWVSSP